MGILRDAQDAIEKAFVGLFSPPDQASFGEKPISR
jgi:hypothetical protein